MAIAAIIHLVRLRLQVPLGPLYIFGVVFILRRMVGLQSWANSVRDAKSFPWSWLSGRLWASCKLDSKVHTAPRMSKLEPRLDVGFPAVEPVFDVSDSWSRSILRMCRCEVQACAGGLQPGLFVQHRGENLHWRQRRQRQQRRRPRRRRLHLRPALGPPCRRRRPPTGRQPHLPSTIGFHHCHKWTFWFELLAAHRDTFEMF